MTARVRLVLLQTPGILRQAPPLPRPPTPPPVKSKPRPVPVPKIVTVIVPVPKKPKRRIARPIRPFRGAHRLSPYVPLSNMPPARISAIDPAFPVFGNPTTASVRGNFAAAKDEIEALQAEIDGGLL